MEHNGLIAKLTPNPIFENLTAEANLQGAATRYPLIPHWTELLPSEQLAYIDLIRRGIERSDLTKEKLPEIEANLLPHYPHPSPGINQSLAPLLIKMNPGKAVP